MALLNKDKFNVIGCEDINSDIIVRSSISYWADAWRRLKKNKVAMASLILLLIIIIMCIIGPWLSPFKFDAQNYNELDMPPNEKHWFGTDNLGRDLFVRLWKGGRVSLLIGFAGTFIEIVIGCLYGGICGYFGGKVDIIMMRIIEIIVSIPYLIVVILLLLVFSPGVPTLILALCITGWPSIARLIRGQVMQLKEAEYVSAAKALGGSSARIIAKHLIPNTTGIILVYMSMDIPSFIFDEAFLSFLGLGVQPPNTSWGALVFTGQGQMTNHPHELIFPAIAISVTMLAFNLFGDGLRDALDPKLRQ
ncbi:ABC transporter permease [Clostridium sp. DJ247]|uniref:ABC transporter permease n=1 Tax=Clostridium sp. DJ247 TaxID=2726188 RepID=UPI001625CB95|nr:ABC transporter permease [Clostridium sp. DJ247]MBC2582768.1 ABC transporter permease [Clostridium sp. DJ247]